MFETIADFFGGLSDGQMWAATLTAVVSSGFAASWLNRYQGWRRISWSEVYNGPINKHINSRPPHGMWQIHWEGRQISEGSLIILEVRNSGVQTLEPEHFATPLVFTFTGKKVVHFKVRDANEPLEAALRPAQRPRLVSDAPGGGHGPQAAGRGPSDTIVLPLFTLNRREYFRLLVLLEDDGTGNSPKPLKITSGGTLKGGRIKRTAGRARRRWATAVAVALVAATSLGAGMYANARSLRLDATCSQGTLTLAGSTAFSPVAHQVKERYEERCPDATVVLEATNSGEGVDRLRRYPTGARIAMVDTVPGQEPEEGLDAHHAGVIVYAVVAHRALEDDLGEEVWDEGLSHDRLRRVFTGGGLGQDGGRPAHPSVAVVRADGSGTRNAFEKRVLGAKSPRRTAPCGTGSTGVCSVTSTMELLRYVNRTPGAIGYAEADALPFFPNVRSVPIDSNTPTGENVLNGDYDFWAREVLYTRQGATGLAGNFLDFLSSRGMSKVLEGRGFLTCRELEDARNTEARCGAARQGRLPGRATAQGARLRARP
ncbi:substrate-binding domain-containing protein [Streptomyces nitrosporeus]|nr:substrate-binding domain-containing protein [Streptomyces nitrosporeus]GGY96180.1 phosphate-binding protein [Streptomyces nitrosporeus]